VEKDMATFTLEWYLWYRHQYLYKEEFDRGYGAIYSCGGGAQDSHNDMYFIVTEKKCALKFIPLSLVPCAMSAILQCK
jgi:hypothetical protein